MVARKRPEVRQGSVRCFGIRFADSTRRPAPATPTGPAFDALGGGPIFVFERDQRVPISRTLHQALSFKFLRLPEYPINIRLNMAVVTLVEDF